MSKAPAGILEQAQRLVAAARLLPVGEAATVLEQMTAMAQAAQSELLAAAERSGELKDTGCHTVRTFAASVLRRGVNDSALVARSAHRLADFPKLAEAYREGLVHTGNLRVICQWVKACGLAALQAHEDQLVVLATHAGPGEITEFCQRLADVNNPDRDEAKAKALGLRSVKIVRVGDLARLDAMLDPAVADQLRATLAAMTKGARQAERAAEREAEKQTELAREAGGDPGGDSDPWERDKPVTDPRTHGERSADALEQILRAGMGRTDLPTRGRARPHASVSVALETLLGMSGMSEAGQALLHRFGLIGVKTAERLCCDALVRLIVTHGDRVLNVGRRHRVVTARQHTALSLRYRTCVMPGCAIPFADCDIHHLWWWSLGGPTDLELQVPLCGTHHRWLHEGGCSLIREDGALIFRDPHGRTVPDTTQILDQQLDLLHAQTGTGPPAHGPDPPGRATQILNDLGGWPASPYRHGRWGWTGQGPQPPPGHAPSRPHDPR